MNNKLLRHLKTKEERDQFRQRLLHNSDLLEVFVNLLLEDRERSYKRQHSITEYDQSWPYKQADCIGEQRALDTIIALLKLE